MNIFLFNSKKSEAGKTAKLESALTVFLLASWGALHGVATALTRDFLSGIGAKLY